MNALLPSGIHGFEEARIPLRGLAKLAEQELDRIHRSHRIENAAQHIHLFENIARDEKLLFPGARPRDVDCREGPLVGHLTIQNDFRIARALELLEDNLVHSGARVDQSGRDNREGAPLLDIARRAEKPLRPLKSIGVHATRQNLA